MRNATQYMVALAVTLLFSLSQAYSVENRRTFVAKALSTVPSLTIGSSISVLTNPNAAFAASTKDLIGDLESSRKKLDDVPALLDQGEWDKVRTILKTTPVNKLWNLGESQNTLVNLAKETGEFELLELKDELAISLQMCDQLTYDNAFVYFQPGNGKVSIKEPKSLAVKAMSQLEEAIKLAGN
mmetsp:Transcript_13433/g.15118  ORF Transcript_13433/g.15118 Transcript_13433/m.15118 type:complete len:184 (+) Transcript_13433:214-765(+)